MYGSHGRNVGAVGPPVAKERNVGAVGPPVAQHRLAIFQIRVFFETPK